MNFLKKFFSKEDKSVTGSQEESSFVCENCKQKRPLSQKKEHMASEAQKPKNVCEFC